jgi:hypothetical protein
VMRCLFGWRGALKDIDTLPGMHWKGSNGVWPRSEVTGLDLHDSSVSH